FAPSVALSADSPPAGETTLAVAPASSELAVATGTAERYRIALPGEPAGPARWRTSSAGRGEFAGTAGRLRLGSEGELKFSEASQRVELTAGRLFVTATRPWTVDVPGLTVDAPGLTVELSEGAEAELQIIQGPFVALRLRREGKSASRVSGYREVLERRIILQVLQGKALVVGKAGGTTEVAAGKSAWLRDDPRQIVQNDLSEEERDRIVDRWETPAVESGIGQLQIQDPQTQSWSRLQLARYHVNVVLSPPVALVQIDQSFYNPHQRTLEGTFTFNLPAGASVSRFAMYTSPTELVEGELIGRERANEVYDRIVRRKLDPAILEQVGRNTFKMRVFPIPGRDVKRILLDYTLPLADRGNGEHRFELPLAADIAPIRDFRITGRILGATTPKSLTFPGSPRTTILPVAEDPLWGTDLRFELVERGFVSAAPFVVQFRQPAGQGPTYREQQITTGPAQKPENIFLATIPPSALIAADADVLPTATNPFAETDARPVDLLILAQSSIDTPQRGRLRSAVRTLVRSLGTADRWQLGCADADFRPLTQEWLAPQGEGARLALASFDREFFLGAFDPAQVLQSALDHLGPVDPQRRRLVVLISDASMPKERPLRGADREAIVGKFREAATTLNLVELGDGNSWRMEFQTLAHQTGGRVFSAGTETRWRDLFAWSLDHFPLGVRIASVQADGVPADDLFAPPLWSPTEPLLILGRRPTTGDFSLTVRLEWRGRTFDRELTIVKQSDDDRFVGRLWGQRKLDQLQEKLLATKESAAQTEVKNAIFHLSQEWTLLSSQTAFLVLETEKDYKRWNIVRGRRRPFWEPEGATVAEPLSLAELARLRRDRVTEPSDTAYKVRTAFKHARQARVMGDWPRLRWELNRLKNEFKLAESDEFRQLAQQSEDAIQQVGDREKQNLGDHRTLFERPAEGIVATDVRQRLRDALESLQSQRTAAKPQTDPLDKLLSPPQQIMGLAELA
ncbi:MAG: VIT and VWA domain-containing protein, partial [Planctomycetota bacterium]|nr:VIT and VWA domain-containing protein [Planctomycetota bacterium]